VLCLGFRAEKARREIPSAHMVRQAFATPSSARAGASAIAFNVLFANFATHLLFSLFSGGKIS